MCTHPRMQIRPYSFRAIRCPDCWKEVLNGGREKNPDMRKFPEAAKLLVSMGDKTFMSFRGMPDWKPWWFRGVRSIMEEYFRERDAFKEKWPSTFNVLVLSGVF